MFVICNHMLVSGNLSGRLLVRNLQPCSSASLKKILRPVIAVDLWLMGVFATVDGDLITHTDAKTVSCVARITSTEKSSGKSNKIAVAQQLAPTVSTNSIAVLILVIPVL